ncbi:lisH domain-containing protein ARMC9 isoform X2 [Nematostella vectensis]|uniref:lisH domain-containing protein ARMC9 isoform X2 n=1 Tax=Nematostella vectensis TaxID=45351 RepID=UPI00207754D8|nr:lisH domain-containing protein ARMC9 isoform X2 [Nematostella vectensis]
MDAVISVEPELNAIVSEYLEFLNYNKTIAAFEEELSLLGKKADFKGSLPQNENQVSELQLSILSAFDNGSYQTFFTTWNNKLPVDVLQSDSTCQKLEFNLNIYFAVYPITNGRQNTWGLELRSTLDSFLKTALKSQEKPKLYTLFKVGPDTVEKERKIHAEQVRLLHHQLSEVEHRSAQHFKKYSRIQGDYHKLIGVAAELVDSLENAVRGKMVTPEYLHDICMRLFNNSSQDSIDVTKPGTASSMLRASIAQNAQSLIAESVEVNSIPALDFEKIKSDLVSLPDHKRTLLLQALRWRLTKAKNMDARIASARAFIIHDLLGLSVPDDIRKGVLQILSHASDVVRQYMARLINAMASLAAGRSYLTQNSDLILVLHSTLVAEKKTSITSDNILGALQKLSLRRRLQSVMIENDLIQWLVGLLEDHDSLSDYALEYAVALLMNLVLRSKGKKRCISDAGTVLKVLSDLLGHENQEIRPYINGALYSLLALPAIKEAARAMGMESILECFLDDDTPELKRQIQFIIKQLNTENPQATNAPMSDDEDEEDDDDFEGDTIDMELDKHEVQLPVEGELAGNELLAAEYSMGKSPTKSKPKSKLFSGVDPDQPLTRPTTPGMRPPEPINDAPHIPSRPGTTTIRPASTQSRPMTSSSRPGTRPTEDEKPSVTINASRPGSTSSTSSRKQKMDPFSSRPKLPRTPEPLGRTGASTPPPLARSISPTRVSKSRQGSAGSRKGSQS